MTARRRLWSAVALLTLAGLVLRLLAAQGALWLDEAWSAVSAVDAGTPLGVFLNINHDNNHHLNSLWLQLVGEGAAPVLQRGLAIASGTAAIPLAAAITRRTGPAAALIAATLFAVSPVLVTYGAEARGYAPMLLALLAIFGMLARWLDAPEGRAQLVPLALAAMLGVLAQLTMVFGLAALMLWPTLALAFAMPWRAAATRALPVLFALGGGTLAALALTLGIAARAGGMHFGNFDPFTLASWSAGAGLLLFWTTGGQATTILLAASALVARAQRNLPVPPVLRGAALLVLAPLLAVPLLQLGNAGMPRYYVAASAGLLIAGAIGSGAALANHRLRWPAAALLVLVVGFSLRADLALIRDRRADANRALVEIMRRAPTGSQVALDRPRASAVLRSAAASARYPLAITEAECPPAPFLFVDRDGDQPFPAQPTRCGARYASIAEGHPKGLSGTHWKLYERIP